MLSAPPPKGRNVKSAAPQAVDSHERRKDYLGEAEVAALKTQAK